MPSLVGSEMCIRDEFHKACLNTENAAFAIANSASISITSESNNVQIAHKELGVAELGCSSVADSQSVVRLH